jgi:hypothetical protein
MPTNKVKIELNTDKLSDNIKNMISKSKEHFNNEMMLSSNLESGIFDQNDIYCRS